MSAIDRNDVIVNVLISILVVLVVGGAALGIYFICKNCEAQQCIVNGYVIDKDMTAARTEQRIYYNGINYYTSPSYYPASYTITIQSDEDSELTAIYSVSAGKYEIYNIGDYIANVNEVL
jgi:hypothetical protein